MNFILRGLSEARFRGFSSHKLQFLAEKQNGDLGG